MPKTAFKVFVDASGTVYGPGYTNPVPDDVAEGVRNESIWQVPEEDDEDGAADDEEPADTEPPAPRVEAPAAAPAPVPEPPRSGAGSGLPAWRAFADSRDVSYPQDAERGDVIAACREAGVIS
jgi:hypothetical protein